ncbi:hypothetical protein ANN_16414 [Periplaneta americana]|uniref:Uncharacterized protein n=1 Tax=Periplaneta americana TaxID=6978 RepID=A0ABQ8SIX0_PERAM|nr:hypothetical protein ANN_16414 [Periplaneta americana]
MGTELMDAILTIRAGLDHVNKCCKNYQFFEVPPEPISKRRKIESQKIDAKEPNNNHVYTVLLYTTLTLEAIRSASCKLHSCAIYRKKSERSESPAVSERSESPDFTLSEDALIMRKTFKQVLVQMACYDLTVEFSIQRFFGRPRDLFPFGR